MLEETIDATGPIQEAVIGMNMKVDEIFLHDGVFKSKMILGKAAERSRILPNAERKLSVDGYHLQNGSWMDFEKLRSKPVFCQNLGLPSRGCRQNQAAILSPCSTIHLIGRIPYVSFCPFSLSISLFSFVHLFI
jgi:hypothetical protein